MTERKPAGMSFGSWIDEQIRQAEERGAFDDLPGTGKPLPKRDEDAAQAWLREYLKREGISSAEMLPAPLKLRKEREHLAENITSFRSEEEIREVARELNYRIVEFRRFPEGPPVYVPLADADALVQRWQEAREPSGDEPAASSAAGTGLGAESPARTVQRRRKTARLSAGSTSGRSARLRWWSRRTLKS